MKSPSQIWKEFSWTAVGQWCKNTAVKSGVLIMYLAGVYLVAMAWLYEPWNKDAVICSGATLAGIAVFAAAWYLGSWTTAAPPVEAKPARPAERPIRRNKKR